MKSLVYLFICFIFVANNLFAQKLNTDSLLNLYVNAKTDKLKLEFVLLLSRQFKNNDNVKSKEYALLSRELSEKLNDKNSLATSYLLLSAALMNEGNLDSAKIDIANAEKLVTDDLLKAEILIVKGNLFDIKGDIKNSLIAFIDAEKIASKIKNDKMLASAQLGIGNMNFQLNDYKKALQYFIKSKNTFQKIGNITYTSYAIHNAATCYENIDSLDKALNLYKESLSLKLKINDNYGASYTFGNIGGIYFKQNNFSLASEYFKKAIEYKQKVDGIANETLASAYQAMADVLLKSGQNSEAMLYADTALNLAIKSSSLSAIANATKTKAIVLAKSQKFSEAFSAMFNYANLSDSLHQLNTSKSIAEMQAKYETEKKDAEIDMLNKDSELEKLKSKRQKTIILFGAFVLLLVAAFSYFLYTRLKLIRVQKTQIENQKHLVEEKQKEIVDSITYAKRLQQAILPPNSLVQKYLPNSFILYKPKDIVAGDFYWLEHKNDLVMIAAADCTGHGVPGAMVSVVCSNALNRTVKEFGLTESGKILDKVRELVIETFEKSESEVKDGMDISLCVIDFKNKKLQWSGANNPLWIVRRDIGYNKHETDQLGSQISNLNSHILIEYKADKQPIGKYAEPKPFTTNEIELQSGDTLYIFTDGYADQFGGEKGKKYKAAKMKEMILSIQEKSMDGQRELIDASFEAWKGELEQVDDVCIIGVKI